jgi:hypothetical protein
MGHIRTIRRPREEDHVAFSEAFIEGSEVFQYILFELPSFRRQRRDSRRPWSFVDQVHDKVPVGNRRFRLGGVKEHLAGETGLHSTTGRGIWQILDLIPPSGSHLCHRLGFFSAQEFTHARPGFAAPVDRSGRDCGV